MTGIDELTNLRIDEFICLSLYCSSRRVTPEGVAGIDNLAISPRRWRFENCHSDPWPSAILEEFCWHA